MKDLQPRKIKNVWIIPEYNDDGTFSCWEAILCGQWNCDAPMSKECKCWMEESQPDETFNTLAQAKAWIDTEWRNDSTLRSIIKMGKI